MAKRLTIVEKLIIEREDSIPGGARAKAAADKLWEIRMRKLEIPIGVSRARLPKPRRKKPLAGQLDIPFE